MKHSALAVTLVGFLGIGVAVGAAHAGATDGAVASVIARARQEVSTHVVYDGTYRVLTFEAGVDTRRRVYPGGDLDPRRGVCTDVVVRAFRAAGLDLQRAVHEDIVAAPRAYPFVHGADANIDHRRVHPLMTWMDRHARALPTTPETWRPGDVVVWSFKPCPACSPNHIGVVSDRVGPRGVPLVLHNLGPEPTEDDTLDAWTVLRHFRVL